MTQNHKVLINRDYVRQLYIEQANDCVKLIAEVDVTILIGTYSKMEHAEAALKFIGACMVDESKQHKVIQVPTRAEMELDNKLQSDQFNPKDIKELFKSIMPESMLKNFDDLSFNPFSMPKSID